MRAGAFLFTLILAAGAAAAQDDVIQLRTGTDEEPDLLVGKVLKITDSEVFFQDRKGNKRTIPVLGIDPYSLYRLKVARIEETGAAHFALGEWCLAEGLYTMAVREFRKAMDLDAALAEKCEQKLKAAREEDARIRWEEAKRHILQQKWEPAAKALGYIMRNYGDTPYGEKAREESEKVAQAIREENLARVRQLQMKKEEKKQKKENQKTVGEKRLIEEARKLLEESDKSYKSGLESEGKDNLTYARRGWAEAERNLKAALARAQMAAKSEDSDIAAEAREAEKEITELLVRTYWRLGRNYAEHLSFKEALHYVNQGLTLPHDPAMDRLLNELILIITQVRMRERAAGKGY